MFDEQSIIITGNFEKQGYPRHLILESLNKARAKTREELLDTSNKEPKSEDSLIMVTTYQPGFKGLKEIIYENWDLLK